ncbi:MAG: FMN-binding protein [Bacillus subtilis]|nr:FMN-binding protein [Bacillus subtilis]
MLAIVAVLVAIFILGGAYSNFMTKQITFHQYADLFENATSVDAFVPEEVDEDAFVAAYQVYRQKTLIGVIYVVSAAGRIGDLQIAYGIDIQTHKTTGVKVIAQSETPEYYNRIGAAFFNQFQNYSFDQLNMQIATVAGATDLLDRVSNRTRRRARTICPRLRFCHSECGRLNQQHRL